mmetsp:Transcript_15502/g.62408  ORF Transcript_15502/g.62408 Transcript_15502/m.62408 type:complete len:250 (-) Transcript_15502:849-1598(-)
MKIVLVEGRDHPLSLVVGVGDARPVVVVVVVVQGHDAPRHRRAPRAAPRRGARPHLRALRRVQDGGPRAPRRALRQGQRRRRTRARRRQQRGPDRRRRRRRHHRAPALEPARLMSVVRAVGRAGEVTTLHLGVSLSPVVCAFGASSWKEADLRRRRTRATTRLSVVLSVHVVLLFEMVATNTYRARMKRRRWSGGPTDTRGGRCPPSLVSLGRGATGRRRRRAPRHERVARGDQPEEGLRVPRQLVEII